MFFQSKHLCLQTNQNCKLTTNENPAKLTTISQYVMMITVRGDRYPLYRATWVACLSANVTAITQPSTVNWSNHIWLYNVIKYSHAVWRNRTANRASVGMTNDASRNLYAHAQVLKMHQSKTKLRTRDQMPMCYSRHPPIPLQHKEHGRGGSGRPIQWSSSFWQRKTPPQTMF